jgi:hypothetical protein
MNLTGTAFVYTGFLASFLGLVSLVRPLMVIGIASRPQGVFVLLCGVVIFLIGAILPAPEKRIEARITRLDDFVPAYQAVEFHAIRIRAPRRSVFAAICEVTADEITLLRTLSWIRRFGQSGKESILNAPPGEPILAVAMRTGFTKLAEEPDREIVLGTMAADSKELRLKKEPTPDQFKSLQAPGFALAAINFRVESTANGETLLTTETRTFASDASSRRKFAAYWRVIYPGSALIRIMWLRAIRLRAAQMPGESSAAI